MIAQCRFGISWMIGCRDSHFRLSRNEIVTDEEKRSVREESI